MTKTKLEPDWAAIEQDAVKQYERIRDSFGRTKQIVFSLPKCLECGAVVDTEDCEMHYNWHRANGTKGAR